MPVTSQLDKNMSMLFIYIDCPTALVAHFSHGIAQMIFNAFIVYNIHTFACGVQVKCIFSIQQ